MYWIEVFSYTVVLIIFSKTKALEEIKYFWLFKYKSVISFNIVIIIVLVEIYEFINEIQPLRYRSIYSWTPQTWRKKI